MYSVGFAAYPIAFGAYPVGFGAYPVGFGAYPVGLGAYPVGFEGKISIGALDTANCGQKSNGGSERVNRGIEKIRRGVLCRVNANIGGMETGSMVALKRVNGALVRVSGGIGQGQWGY